MEVNLWRNRQGEPSDAEIDRDVSELKKLLDGVGGPSEPHPAYWQNFVVRVRTRIDDEGARRKRRSFSTAWASFGAVAAMTVVVIATGLLDKPDAVVTPPKAVITKAADKPASDLADAYSSTDTKSIILSGEEVDMINAIVSDKGDDAVFEVMVSGDEL
jgi:hypothetical protein